MQQLYTIQTPTAQRGTGDAAQTDELIHEFNGILAESRLHTMYQPIADLREHAVLGYEALIRGPSDSPLHSPLPLFETAIRFGKLFELELLCREVSVAQYRRLKLPGKLFLNASPASLMHPGHRPGQTLEMLKHFGLSPDNIVIELTEQFPLDDYEIVRQATRHYKSMGFEIAIDDLGAGYAGLRMWSELRPDYVKIDKHFIQGIHEDPVKQEFVRSILNIAQGLDCKVIAEGIETRQEYTAVCALGITLGQGYYFARPHILPTRSLPEELFTCDTLQRCVVRPVRLSDTVSCVLKEAPCVGPDTLGEQVLELFSKTPGLQSVAVLGRGGVPLGLARRYRLMDIYATPYGRSLHGRKPITELMDDEPVVVEQDTLVEQASRMVTDNMQIRVEDDFMITAGGRHLGIGKVVDLLRKITELQIRNARYANPLTLLPGNVPIYEILDRLIGERARFAVAYCDLDHFKPFNDVYGYGKGDQVLQKVAAILAEYSDRQQDFVGHLGGDDFIIVFRSDDWKDRCEEMLARFERDVPMYYNEKDRRQRGIWSTDRRGKESFFPILSLSIGLVTPDPERCNSHNEVAAMASDAKRQAKQLSGNSLFVDRRLVP